MIKVSERDDRLKKLEQLKKRGIDPYPAKTERSHSISQVIADFDQFNKEQKIVSLAGRLRSLRGHGNLIFANLEDDSGKIQLVFSKKELQRAATNGAHANVNNVADQFQVFQKYLDIGDFIQVKGTPYLTHAGEKSILVKDWKILAKALRPLPEKWHGLKDEEERLRKRYLDILFNPEVKRLIIQKNIFWQSVRRFLTEQGFLEVETPVLENTTGGADARPFMTHHNAMNLDVYLRISMGELWQKRLMIAGLEKIFEIGRQFRNEGMDAEHLQDYTQMEFYWAYADYQDGMKLVEELFKDVAQKTFSTLKFTMGKFSIDLSKPWQRYDYGQTVKKYTGIDILKTSLSDMEKKLNELKIIYEPKGFNKTRALDNLWKYCRKQIAGPGFLVGLPVAISPLAKRDETNPEITQRFQLIIAGSELGNGYSELNDPLDQAERFRQQLYLREQGDEEAHMFDHDFVEALEYGMPPCCGFGMSERVFAFLSDKNARECQIFPLMKPKD